MRSAAPASVLKPEKDGLAATKVKIPLLPALGSPTPLADLDPQTNVRVVQVVGDHLAYEVVVIATGKRGFVPGYSITGVAAKAEPAPAAEAPASQGEASEASTADASWDEMLARMPPMPSDWPPRGAQAQGGQGAGTAYDEFFPRKPSSDEIAALLARQGISTDESYAKAHEVPAEQKIEAAKAAVRVTAQDPALAELHAKEVRTLAQLEGEEARAEQARQADLPAAAAAQPARDEVHALLVRAGVPRSMLARYNGSRLDSQSALGLVNYLLTSPPSFKQYGPRTIAMQMLFAAAQSEQGLPFQALKNVQDRHQGLVVYTPWEYLVDASTGESLSGSTMPTELQQKDGSFLTGPYRLGEFYANRSNIIYRTDPQTLGPTGTEIAELSPKGIYTSFLDAAEEPLHQGAQGIRNFIDDPKEFVEDKWKALQKLPAGVRQVLSNSPEQYVDMFLALPADRQHYVASQILVAAGSMYLAGSAAAGAAGGIGGSRLMLTLAGDGQLALRMVAAESGVAAGMGGALGAGGALILTTSGSGKQDRPPASPSATKPPQGKPGNITAEMSVSRGLVKEKELLTDLLKGIQEGFATNPPKNAEEAFKIAEKVTERLSTPTRRLRVGNLIETKLAEGYELWRQNGGIETRFYFDGRIVVTRGPDVLLQLSP